MNDQRPTDPREQLEVRITALLLGEASAFEEAELIEAIKHDPALAAYYEEMRQMVKRVEATIQLTPVEAATKQPTFSVERRGKLEELFKQPVQVKTVKLDSQAGRARRLGWLQHATAIAAAVMILATVVWMLLPAFSKARSKTGRISMLWTETLVDQLGGGQPPADEPVNAVAGHPAAKDWAEFAEGDLKLMQESLQSTLQSPSPDADGDRYLARYGMSHAGGRSHDRNLAPAPPREPAAPDRLARIHLPAEVAKDEVRQLDPGQRSSRADSRVEPQRQAHYFADFASDRPSLAPLPALKPVINGDAGASASVSSGRVIPDFDRSDDEVAEIFAKQAADATVGARFNQLTEGESLGLAIRPVDQNFIRERLAEASPQRGVVGQQLERELTELKSEASDSEPAALSGPQDAINEAVRRLPEQVQLRLKLADAQSASERGELTEALRLYDNAVRLAERLGQGVESEHQTANQGMVDAQAQLAELKRNARDPEWLGVLEDRELGEQVLPTQMFDVNPDALYQGMEGVFANSAAGGSGGTTSMQRAPSFFGFDSVESANGSVFTQVPTSAIGEAPGGGQPGSDGIRFLTVTNDMSTVNVALRDYLEAVGVNLTASSMVYYNDRTGRLMVKAPESELSKVQQVVEMLNDSPPRDQSESTQSRFDSLADLSVSEFAVTTDNGREQQVAQQVASAPIAAPEVTQLAEQVVESRPATPPPPSLEPLPEIRTTDNAFSTFSLNVSDVSFQLAASSLENGQLPDGARLRSEEFINAFDYHDPAPAPGQRVAFNWERARNPFAHNRELLRLSVQTAAAGREPGQPLNLVLLLDNSGSMERADRVQITEQMLRVLAAGLNDYDRISVISFARTPRLIVDGLSGGNHQALLDQITGLNPDGGTNLEDALKLGYETAAKHFQANGNNRVILITDGAANLGNVDPAQLRERVIDQRKRGIALDCFGVGWEGYNDNLLESLSRNGDGRYGFLNDADNAVFEFSRQLAGALQVAAADVKAQIEFNPNRVTVYRQIGYQQHQLTKEQFRDNTVDAAEIGAAEAGNALYSVEVNPNGSGPIGTFRARYRVPSTGQYEEKEWVLDYTPGAPELEKSGPAMRLASSSAAFAEWLANSPYAQSVTPDALQNLLRGVPETFAPDPRPAKLQAMIQQARAIGGR